MRSAGGGTGGYRHKLTWTVAAKTLTFDACGTKKTISRTLTDAESTELEALVLELVLVDAACDTNDPLASESFLHLDVAGAAYERARRANGVWYCKSKSSGVSYVGVKDPDAPKVDFFAKLDEYAVAFGKTLDTCAKDATCKAETFP